MASLSSSLLKLVVLALAILALFPSSSLSTSRKALVKHHQKVHQGFRVTLKHVDSGKNLTKFERLQRAMKRGKKRLSKINAVILASASPEETELQSPVHVGQGEFLMKLSIGTPSQTYSAVMDTGSDLIWTQCKPCKNCYNQPTPIFDPENSSTFSKLHCSSQLCDALPTSSCGDSGCEYSYSYGDYSSTEGILASETFKFGDVSVPGLGFGCGEDNQGSGFDQGGGLVGLGRGPLSLVSQLGEQKFSYCLTSVDDSKTSSLLMGSLESLNVTKGSEIKTTPLLKNPLQPSFYYLGLEAITVGGTRLSFKKTSFELQGDGTGGFIIDSGTTITYLEQSAFAQVKKAFTSQTKLPLDDSGSTGLDLCFKLPSDTSQVEVPKLVFNFNGADLELPAENYMIGDTGLGVLCLAMGSSSGMSIFGNVQQQNLLVIHDLEKETMSFVPTPCDQL